jgi:hypothetical protein
VRTEGYPPNWDANHRLISHAHAIEVSRRARPEMPYGHASADYGQMNEKVPEDARQNTEPESDHHYGT